MIMVMMVDKMTFVENDPENGNDGDDVGHYTYEEDYEDDVDEVDMMIVVVLGNVDVLLNMIFLRSWLDNLSSCGFPVPVALHFWDISWF